MIGKTVSHYKIISKLGEGGMGVVYKAEDTRLDRSVALKFLPTALGTQQAAKKRFIREAKAASSLEHPNICAVYDIGETDEGQMFIAMPHYDGETLQERIARGPVETGEALYIVTQLASGLAKAHERGIVHRDIKPGNIFVTKDGHVKILDFGLAKLVTETRLTKSGTTLGTIAYMSPEQASGGDVDARSDIFSLGAVFYELLTGEPPFKGDHEAAILYGIMHNDPEPLQTHRGDITEGVQQVIEKTLAKDADDRYQSTLEFKDALAGLGFHTGSRAMAPTRGGSRSRFARVVPWILMGGAALAVGLFVVRDTLRSPTSDSFPSVSPTHTQLTFTGDLKDPIISPDGQMIACLRENGSRTAILVRDIKGGEPVVLLGDAIRVENLRWSPDSGTLLIGGRLHTGERVIYTVPRLGGSVRRLANYRFAAWSPDGRRVAASWQSWKKVSFIDVATGTEDDRSLNLKFPFTWLYDLDWSPAGDRILLHVSAENGSQEIWTTGVNGDDPIRVVRERALSSPRWSPSGEWIYYVVPTGVVQALWKVQGDSRTAGKAEPFPVLTGITGLGPLAFTNDGQNLTYARHVVDRDLWLLSTSDEWKGSEPVSRRLTGGTALDDWPSVSPNGRDIAFVRVMGDVSNIYIRPIDGGTARQVTFMAAECFSPVWSRDGQKIAFVAYDSGAYRVWTVSTKGGAAHVFEKTRVSEDCGLAWAPGKNILYQKPGNRNFMILDPTSGAESALIANEDLGWVSTPVISPDGRSAAVEMLRKSDDQPSIRIFSMVDSSQTLVAWGHKHPCGWGRDGQWIYYYDVPTIGRIRSDGSNEEAILSLPFEDIDAHPHVSMGPDGKNLVGGFKVQTPSDIWLVENFDPDAH